MGIVDVVLSHPACRYKLSGKGILPVEAIIVSSLRPAARFNDAVAEMGRHVSRVRIDVNRNQSSPMDFTIVYPLHVMKYAGTYKSTEYPQPQSGDASSEYMPARQFVIETHIGTEEKRYRRTIWK